MQGDNLLPAESGRAERALVDGVASAFNFPVPIRDLWSPDRCPAALLPWLAYALSVDDWDESWTEATKREVISASIEIHRRKGTVWAVKRAIAAAGYGDATLIERYGLQLYDGTLTHNGGATHAPADHWAEYRVTLRRPITIAQAAVVRRLLASVAPARSHLKVLDFSEAAFLENGAILNDGIYSHGAA